MNAVVEVPAKSSRTLKRERELLGQWYENGNAERRCYIVNTGNAVFGINESYASAGRLISEKDGTLFAPSWQVRGEIVKDKILWTNGTWWSREPFRHGNLARRDSIKVEGLDRAAGEEIDTPDLLRGFIRSGGQ
jgi:hypothetical protein